MRPSYALSCYWYILGMCLVTSKAALLWTDGRYHNQASKELGEEWTLMKAGCEGVPSLAKWMKTVHTFSCH